jgi:hypothetical protein
MLEAVKESKALMLSHLLVCSHDHCQGNILRMDSLVEAAPGFEGKMVACAWIHSQKARVHDRHTDPRQAEGYLGTNQNALVIWLSRGSFRKGGAKLSFMSRINIPQGEGPDILHIIDRVRFLHFPKSIQAHRQARYGNLCA